MAAEVARRRRSNLLSYGSEGVLAQNLARVQPSVHEFLCIEDLKVSTVEGVGFRFPYIF